MSANVHAAARAAPPRNARQRRVRFQAAAGLVFLAGVVAIAAAGVYVVPLLLAWGLFGLVAVRFGQAWMIRGRLAGEWRTLAAVDVPPNTVRAELDERSKQLAWLGFRMVGTARSHDGEGRIYVAVAEHPRTGDVAEVMAIDGPALLGAGVSSVVTFATAPADGGPRFATRTGPPNQLGLRLAREVTLPGVADVERLYRVHRWRVRDVGPAAAAETRDAAGYVSAQHARWRQATVSRGWLRVDAAGQTRFTARACLTYAARMLPLVRWTRARLATWRERRMLAAAASTDIAL